MKRIFVLLISAALMIGVCGCSRSDAANSSEIAPSSEATTAQASTTAEQSTTAPDGTEQSSSRRIVMTIGENRAVVVLNDTPAADSLYALLPLNVSFEDYNSTEKIGYLTDELDLSDAPDAFDPDVGDFCLYAPWGNLSIFYKDFRNSNSLVPLGRVESGLDYIEKMSDGSSVVIEKDN